MNADSKLYQSIAGLALATVALLLIPLIAMQFTEEVVWTLSDFIFAGALLFGTGLTYKLITRRSGKTIYKLAVGFALFTGLFLIWTNLAVGIIGSEDNPVNLMYFGVLAVGIIGALIARFQPNGMVLALFATALAQGLVAVITLAGGFYHSTITVIEILVVNGLFVFLFGVSALLFRYSAQVKPNRNAA